MNGYMGDLMVKLEEVYSFHHFFNWPHVKEWCHNHPNHINSRLPYNLSGYEASEARSDTLLNAGSKPASPSYREEGGAWDAHQELQEKQWTGRPLSVRCYLQVEVIDKTQEVM